MPVILTRDHMRRGSSVIPSLFLARQLAVFMTFDGGQDSACAFWLFYDGRSRRTLVSVFPESLKQSQSLFVVLASLHIVASGKSMGFKEVVVFLRLFSLWGPKTMVFLRFLYVNVWMPQALLMFLAHTLGFLMVLKGPKKVLTVHGFPALIHS